MKKYATYPLCIVRLRAALLWPLAKCGLLRKAFFFLLGIFGWAQSVQYFNSYVHRSLGFSRVLKKGDTAIQAGVCMTANNTQAFDAARAVGDGGTVVAIEPDPENIRKFREAIRNHGFRCRFIIVQKAVSGRRTKAKFYLGHMASWNRLVEPDYENWKKDGLTFKGTMDVQMDTIDNILKDMRIEPMDVAFVNLTVNGAEFDALKGMKNLIKKSRSLAIAAIAGREKMGGGELGYINGRPDHIVIREFLESMGLKTKFKRFFGDDYGYVVAAKGQRNFFL